MNIREKNLLPSVVEIQKAFFRDNQQLLHDIIIKEINGDVKNRP